MSTPVYDTLHHTSQSTGVETTTPVSVVIPAYNEAGRIAPTLDALHTQLDAHLPRAYELLVVDDGSTDDTVSVASNMGANVLKLDRNQGKGGALRAGMVRAAGSDARAFCDADGSIDAPSVMYLLDAVLDGRTDIAIASRRDGGQDQHESKLRYLGSQGLARVCEWMVPIGLSDTQCGGKAFRADLAADLFGKSQTNGYGFDREILWHARQAGATITSVPVDVIPMPGSHVRPVRDSLHVIRETARLRRSLR